MIREWFARLPIHRKLVVMALLVTGTALVAATAGLIAFDAWRYQEAANDDIMSVAQMVADTSGAAAEFADHRQAQANVDTARLRPAVTRVCLYLTDGTLLAGYHRSRDLRCGPLPMSDVPRMAVSTTLPVRVNDKTVGEVYAERDTSDLWRRIAMTALASGGSRSWRTPRPHQRRPLAESPRSPAMPTRSPGSSKT